MGGTGTKIRVGRRATVPIGFQYPWNAEREDRMNEEKEKKKPKEKKKTKKEVVVFLPLSCYVCEKKIRKDGDYWQAPPTEKYPDGIARHGDCACGSENWLKSKQAVNSPWTQYFKKPVDEGGIPKMAKIVSPEQQLVKEFVGRVKYMAYMDSMAKVPVEWSILVQDKKITLKATGVKVVEVNGKLVAFAPKDTLMGRILNMVSPIS
jgi:hypothetical protein